MATIEIPNVRQESTVLMPTTLKDNGVAVDWSGLQNIKAYMYSDAQRVIAGKCDVEVDGEDATVLKVTYAATRPQYLGVNSLLVRCKYHGREKSYDVPVLNFVERTAQATGMTVLDDPVIDVKLEVDEVSTSLLDGAIAAALDAAVKAEEAASLVPLQVLEDCVEATENAETATAAANEAAEAANAAGITSVQASVADNEPGTPSVEVSLLNKVLSLVFHHLKGLKGDTGATPNITVGTVATGAPGTPVVITMTGTAAAPVLNITIPQGLKGDKGDQGNTGSSVEFPYELVNNLTTNDATKGLSAAQGVVLDGKISQLDQKVVGKIEIPLRYPGAYLADAGGVGSTVAIYSPVFTSGWNCYMAPCSGGDTVIVNGTGGASPRLWAFVDADYKILEAAAASASASNLEKTAPANSAFVIINDKTNAKSYIISQSSLTKLSLANKSENEDLQRLNAESLRTSGIDISFVDKAHTSIPFGMVLPAGTVLNNNGYAAIIYLYDYYGTQYTWNPANRTYTTPEGITYFKPTNSSAGRITTQSEIKILNDLLANIDGKASESMANLGVYRVSIWGGQVNKNTGELYNSAYNGFHFSNAIPIASNDTCVFCPDSHISWYMFYSAMPVIGANSEIYLGNNATGIIPAGAKYAIAVFENQYIPSDQPFYFYTNEVAYDVFFSKKMKGKKLVTIGDSLVQICAWQPRLRDFSGLSWSYDETYSGVGYVSLIDGTYTTEDKSADANYRAAYKMGYGGSSIRPSSDNSAYIRSKDAKFYNPDVIIIWAGENDGIEDWKSSGNTGTTPDEIVAQETPYRSGVADNTVSTIAAYKGMIEQLMENNPNVIIYLATSMRAFGDIGKDPTGVYEHVFPHPRFSSIQDVLDWENTYRYPKVEYVRAIARYYSLPIIDLWAKSGINDYNAGVWFGESADNCIQVHPLQVGYNRVADVMLQCI